MSFSFISKQNWRLFHERDNVCNYDPLSALVYQDSFIRYLPYLNEHSQQQIGGVHFYPYMYPIILLGGKDTRLKEETTGYKFLQDAGYQTVIRPHGGLAVVNDPGIVNFALMSDMKEEKLTIDEAYENITRLIQEAFAPYDIVVEHYEVANSYCPGTYDLVVNGQKIGGTAQRRFKNGLTTAAYLSLNGDQRKRAELIRDFYEQSHADDSYPKVDWRAMTTLSDILGREYTQKDFETDIINVLKRYSTVERHDFSDPELKQIYHKQYPTMKQRNDVLLF